MREPKTDGEKLLKDIVDMMDGLNIDTQVLVRDIIVKIVDKNLRMAGRF